VSHKGISGREVRNGVGETKKSALGKPARGSENFTQAGGEGRPSSGTVIKGFKEKETLGKGARAGKRQLEKLDPRNTSRLRETNWRLPLFRGGLEGRR